MLGIPAVTTNPSVPPASEAPGVIQMNDYRELGKIEASSVQSAQVFSFDKNQLQQKNYYQAVNRWLKALSERGAVFNINYKNLPVDAKFQEITHPEFYVDKDAIRLRYSNGTSYPSFAPKGFIGSFSIKVKFPGINDVNVTGRIPL